MHIAFVVNNYPPKVGGVEVHVHSLASHLRDLGHEVSVYTLGAPEGVAVEEGVRVVRQFEHMRIGGILGFPRLGATHRLTRDLRARRVEVVSIHTRFFPMSWIGLRAGHRAGAVVVHTEHGSGHVVSPSLLVRVGSRLVDLTVGRSVLRRSDAVLGVSEQVIDFVQRLSGVKGRVFYNAIDSPVGPSSPRRPTRLVFVGRLVPGKGWEDFIEVVGQLVARGRPIRAELLGDGPDRADVERLIAARGLERAITVRGRVGADLVREALAGAVLVNPTVLAEGFQTTLLEALAENGQVVTYPVPGAAVLRDQGHPIEIVEQRASTALAQAVDRIIDSANQPDAAPRVALDDWFWPRRAREYAEICASVHRDAPRPGG